jgi:EAL domain-containing protein (putative c-di-GMP-specific phosphodiesterase class I)
MAKRESRQPDLERYRTGYLKLRSVLHDRVTDLPALPLVLDDLRGALEHRRRIGVVHVELLELDLVESLYGWQVLDRLLSRVASTIRGTIGGALPAGSLPTISAVSGDGFVVFVLERPDGGEVDGPFLARIGRALVAELQATLDGEDLAGLATRILARAGHALLSMDPFYRFERRVYAALDEARGFHERRERRRELSWAEELEQIIHERRLDTVFQPVVDLRSKAVIGHEAFVRGPRDSMFEMPSAMFALSSRVGVAGDLDRSCCEAAIVASARMVESGKLFLNLRPASLDGDDPAVSVLARARAANLDPADVVLEFSERLAEDLERFLAVISACRKQGFQVALDDVGTGYSSREIVERARPDYLKLDVSLVRRIDQNLIKQEVLFSLLQLGRQFGASVIAEGVETEAEAETLRHAGTPYGQGYLFAVPAEAAAFSGGQRRQRR